MSYIDRVTVDGSTYTLADGRLGTSDTLVIPVSMGGTGATNAAAARTNLGITDTKVTQTASTDTGYHAILSKETTGTATATEGAIFNSNISMKPSAGSVRTSGAAGTSGSGYWVSDPDDNSKTSAAMLNYRKGTTSQSGIGMVVLGNSTAEGTSNNYKGDIKIYGTQSYSHDLYSGATTSSYSAHLAAAGGWVAIGGSDTNNTGEGSSSTPIYMDNNGELKPVSSVDSSLLTTLTASQITTALGYDPATVDEKVSQVVITSSETYPLIIKGTSATTGITGTVGFTSVIYSNPNKANITVKGPANSSSASGAAFRVLPENGSTTVATLMNYEEGTTESVGTGALVIGNAIGSGTAGNAKGMAIIYGESTVASRVISNASSSSKTVVIPNKSGWIAIGGDGSETGVGTVSKPVYMKKDGTLAQVTSINSDLITLTSSQITTALGYTPAQEGSGGSGEDTKVTQTVKSGNYDYPILAKGTTAVETTTGTVSFASSVKLNAKNGRIETDGDASNSTSSAAGFRIKATGTTVTVASLFKYQEPTSSTAGIGSLLLGNSAAEGTEGSARGRLAIYSSTAYGNVLFSKASGSNKTSYFPNVAGWIAIGGDGSSTGVGSVSTPIYMTTAGKLEPVTSITSTLITLTKSQVTTALGYTPPQTDNDTYPTALTWTNGAANGPVPKISRAGTTTTVITGSAIPAASGLTSGVVTTGSQTFAGAKTFSATVYFANGTTYYVGSTGHIKGNNISSVGTLTAGTTLTMNGRLIGKSGSVTAGNYTTTAVSSWSAGQTGQIMFKI